MLLDRLFLNLILQFYCVTTTLAPYGPDAYFSSFIKLSIPRDVNFFGTMTRPLPCATRVSINRLSEADRQELIRRANERLSKT
jgi:hypothetical protein